MWPEKPGTRQWNPPLGRLIPLYIACGDEQHDNGRDETVPDGAESRARVDNDAEPTSRKIGIFRCRRWPDSRFGVLNP
jgi:hypothetical protein